MASVTVLRQATTFCLRLYTVGKHNARQVSARVCSVAYITHTHTRCATCTTLPNTRTDLSCILACPALCISAQPVEPEALGIEYAATVNHDVVQDRLGNTATNITAVDPRPVMSADTRVDLDCAVTQLSSQPLPQRCAADINPTSMVHR